MVTAFYSVSLLVLVLNILNAMVLYNDLDCKEDYIPYISALLNIPPKKDYNVKLLNKISLL